jgi:hypothetical protein
MRSGARNRPDICRSRNELKSVLSRAQYGRDWGREFSGIRFAQFSELSLSFVRLIIPFQSTFKKKGAIMALDLMREKGVPFEEQLMSFTWRDMVRVRVSKLDDDAFTKVRIILMNGIESEQLRFKYLCGRLNENLRLPLAQVRTVFSKRQ